MQKCDQKNCEDAGIVCYDWPGRGLQFGCWKHGKHATVILREMGIDAKLRYPDCGLCGGSGTRNDQACPACLLVGAEV